MTAPVSTPAPIDEAQLERACVELLQRDAAREAALGASGRAVLALGWMYMDLARATALLEGIAHEQQQDGRIPPVPDATGLALPLAASIVRMVYHAARSRQRTLEPRLARLVEPLDRFHRRFAAQDRGRLFHASPLDETVLAPTPGDAARAADDATADVGVNALLVQAESDLADVAIHTGYPTRSIVARRTRRAQALAEKLWDAAQGAFVSRAAGGPAPCTVESLLPLWAGAAPRQQAYTLVARHLDDPAGFWSPFPLASLPQHDSRFAHDAPGRGAMSPLVNWLLVRGLYRYGLAERARLLSEVTLRACEQHGPREGYSARTGEGCGLAQHAPTAALALDLLKTPYTYARW